MTPFSVAVACAAVLTALPCAFMAGEAAAQTRSNAQAEQSRAIRSQPRATLASGRYVAESGEGFVVDRSGNRPLVRFDRRDETWALRATPAPRGDIIYRNDAGQQVLRVSASGAMTVYTSRAPSGSPATFTGAGSRLEPPTLGPARLFSLMARRSATISQALGRLVEINLDGERSEALCVEALVVTTDTILRLAQSPTSRSQLNALRSVTITEGSRVSVSYTSGRLMVMVDPDQGMGGRPSSAQIVRALTD